MDVGTVGTIFVWVGGFWPIIAAWLVAIKFKKQISNLPMYYVASVFLGYILVPVAGLIIFMMEKYTPITNENAWGNSITFVVFFGLIIFAPRYFAHRYKVIEKNSFNEDN